MHKSPFDFQDPLYELPKEERFRKNVKRLSKETFSETSFT